ncbi:MAG TPA: acyl-homoserine-lactone synthase [Rhizomicrobium sp.]|jgi:acyl-homoserine lactone synthase|nr:acyl-homoserine-lactone synthase [Rhizomicrobium sp.]
MIHMITQENRHLYRAELKEMHELRRIHFIEERGWAAMQVRDGGEFDGSDDDRAIYFIALDEDGHVAVSMRARPTDDKCIVADVFPHLIEPESGDVRGSDIWEISRIFATKSNRLRQGIKRRNEVLLACIEAATLAGVSRLVAMVDTFLWSQVLRYPWNISPLGLPSAYDEGEVIGFGVTVNRHELSRVRRELRVAGSVLMPTPSAATLTPQEMELLLTAGRLAPNDLALVKQVIAFARQTPQATGEQLSAVIERKQAQRAGAGSLH